jgi:hypothetical protein
MGVMDSSFRWRDKKGARVYPSPIFFLLTTFRVRMTVWELWIPAFAGMTKVKAGMTFKGWG